MMVRGVGEMRIVIMTVTGREATKYSVSHCRREWVILMREDGDYAALPRAERDAMVFDSEE